MERKETIEVIKAVETYYQNKFRVDDPKALLDAWHNILQDYDFETIMHNLQNYVKTNRFAPSVADIINAEPEKDRAIPSRDETLAMMQKWDQDKEQAADPDIANDHLAKMRQILGIKRG